MGSRLLFCIYDGLAQSVEHSADNAGVAGSNPAVITINMLTSSNGKEFSLPTKKYRFDSDSGLHKPTCQCRKT